MTNDQVLLEDQVKVMKEIRDRLRRVETRLTIFMAAQGFDTQTQPNKLVDDMELQVPSMEATLKSMLDSLGPLISEVAITHQGVIVGYISRAPRT
jgi:uncharacterized protein (DUF1501 family)